MIESIRTKDQTDAPKPKKKPRKRAPSVQQKTVVPPAEQVKSDHMPDQKPTEPLTTAQRIDALGKLLPDDLSIFQQLVTKLEQGESPEVVQAWYESELGKQDAAKPTPSPEPVATQDAAKIVDPLEIESVHTIARAVFAKMLTNEIGSRLFPRGLSHLDENYDVVGGLYYDIVDAIISGLAGCDMDELHTAACLGSVRK